MIPPPIFWGRHSLGPGTFKDGGEPMTIVPGLIALAVLGAGDPMGPGSGTVATLFRVLEMDGLGWRGEVHGKLQFVSRQGSATIWTAGAEVVEPLIEAADEVIEAPRVVAKVDAPAAVKTRNVRSYVAQLGRIADGPVGHASAIAFQPEIQQLSDGLEARVACRPLDQGVLARIALETSWCVALHTATQTETVTPDEEGRAKGLKPTPINASYQVPEVATCRVAGEWLIPDGGVLVVSLGVRTVPEKALFGTRAAVRERVVIIESRPLAAPTRDAPPPAEAEPAVAANRPLPAPPVHAPIACAPLPVPAPPVPAMPGPQDVICLFDAIGPDGLRTRIYGPEPMPVLPPVVASAPVFSDPVVQVVTMPLPVPATSMVAVPVPVGAVMSAPAVAFAAPGAAVLPIAPPPPSAPTPPPAPEPEPEGGEAPTDRAVVSTSATSDEDVAKTYADVAGTGPTPQPRPSTAEEPESDEGPKGDLPELPSRHLPEAYNADGDPVRLPPLPDETAAALAMDQKADTTPGPKPSPQSRPHTGLPGTAVAAAGTGTVELKGRVSIRLGDGTVLEADSIVLKPPAGTMAATGDVRVTPTSGLAPAAAPPSVLAPAQVPAFVPPGAVPSSETHAVDVPPPCPKPCAEAPHPPAACAGDPAACSFRDATTPAAADPTPTPAAGEEADSRSTWRLSLPAAIRIAAANAGQPAPADSVVDRLLVSKGIASDGLRVEEEAAITPLVRSVIQAYADLGARHAQLWACRMALEAAERIAGNVIEAARFSGERCDLSAVGRGLETARSRVVDATSAVRTAERELRNVLGLPQADNRRILPSTDMANDGTSPDPGTLSSDATGGSGPVDAAVAPAGHVEAGSTQEKAFQCRLPIDRGAIDLKVRIGRTRRPLPTAEE